MRSTPRGLASLLATGLGVALTLACGGSPDASHSVEPGIPAAEAPALEVPPPPADEAAEPGEVTAAEPAAAEPAAASSSGAPSGKVFGKLSSVRGQTLVVSLDGAAPGTGATGKLFKKVKKQLGKMSFEAWLDVADVTVKSVSGADVTLTVTQENSVVTVNGQKKSHFEQGAAVRLEW